MAKQKPPVAFDDSLIEQLVSDARATRDEMLRQEEEYEKAERIRIGKIKAKKQLMINAKKTKRTGKLNASQKWWQKKSIIYD